MMEPDREKIREAIALLTVSTIQKGLDIAAKNLKNVK